MDPMIGVKFHYLNLEVVVRDLDREITILVEIRVSAIQLFDVSIPMSLPIRISDLVHTTFVFVVGGSELDEHRSRGNSPILATDILGTNKTSNSRASVVGDHLFRLIG
jgi:hypothetical protein